MTRATKTSLALAALAALGASGAALLPTARPARADEAADSLAKYRDTVDAGVDRALAWLAQQQHKEGYWPSGMGKTPAVASLAVMAFLAKGYTPGTGPYGQHIDRGIDFVLSCQRPNGLIVGGKTHGAMYIHGMCTLMLSEVSGMVDPERQKRIDKALPHAVRLILTAQQVKKPDRYRGGWRYQPTSTDSDISLTGWQLMALRSARNNGAQVPKKAIEDAVGFVLRCRAEKWTNPKTKKSITPKPGTGVGFAYQPGGAPGLARTSVALLCLELCGRHRCKEAVAAGDWVLRHRPTQFGSGYFYYALYYASQGMFQLGGRHWEQFAPHMYEMMLKFQAKDGSWPQGSGGEAAAGKCYSTAMGVLAMAVSYRQLPIYQR